MASEVLSIAAKKGDMPKFLAKENANQRAVQSRC